MQNNSKESNISEDSLDQNRQIQRLIFRILPYWPIIVLCLILGFLGARIYLRYATKIYAAKARVIVNDDSQQKTANLIDIMQLDTRNMSTETEKEMEILGSRDLLSKLTVGLQLNVQYGLKGYIKSGSQNIKNLPFTLELKNPDSVTSVITEDVHIIENKISFNNQLYPCDTFVQTDFGKIKWHLKPNKIDKTDGDWFVTIQPVTTTVSQIQRSLSIVPISKQSSILSITYNDEIPERGLNILQNLLTLYGSSTIDYKSRISENTLRFLEERLKLVSSDLGGIEKELQNYKTTNNIVDLSEQGKVVLGQLQETDTKISELNVQMDVLNNIEGYVVKRNNSGDPIPATLGITDPVLTDLLNQLYKDEFDLQQVQQTSGVKNPRIDVLKESIDKLKPSILTSINNLKSGIRVSKQRLESDNNKLSSVLDKMPIKERQLLDISRQQGIKNGIYTFLLQKKEEQAINAAGIDANYRVIDKPEISGKVFPKTQIVYLLGIILGILIMVLYIYLVEFSSTRLKFRSQIETRTKVPILAEIAFQPNAIQSPIVVEEGKRTLIAEEFRELRTNLSYITFNTKEKSKIILITSSIPNEGKSFIAINTSISLSLTGSRVILLEFDLRKPKISKQIGIDRNLGLSTFLIGKADKKDIIQAHPSIPNLSIIASGPIPPNPSELLSSPRLTELFDYLKQDYDYILIDSPPVGSVTDGKILAGLANATLYIVRQNYTHSSFLELLNELQKKRILPNLNIIFNGIKIKTIPGYRYGPSYGYGYKYGYGSGYGYGYGYGGGYYSDEKKKKGRMSFWWKKK